MTNNSIVQALFFIVAFSFLPGCKDTETDKNSAPTANIHSPANGTVFQVSSSILFAGFGNDAEDVYIDGNALTWTSSIDGTIGTDTMFYGSLSEGEHTIVLTATDSDQATGKDSVRITVEHLGTSTYDLSGTWNYVTSENWVSGLCQAGANASGTLTITQEDSTATMVINSGMVCDPASMCSYNGTVKENVYTFTNSAIVDDEGGEASNTIVLTAVSANAAAGNDISSYVLNDFSCSWGFNISMTRQE